jgi:sugar phosphate isomerase/epimerase
LPSSRRDVLKLLPAVALSGLGQEFRHEPGMRFPESARERLAVTSYPFRAYLESPTNPGRKPSLPGMDMLAFPKFISEKFGVRNINPLVAHFRSTDAAYLEAFRGAVAKAGSHVVDLGLGGANFYSPDPSTRQQAVDAGCRWIDVASKIGSPSVRQHLHLAKGEKPQAVTAAEGLRRLADYGAKRNIVINLENDNAIAEDPFLIVDIIEKVKSPYLRALPDFGNSLIGHDAHYNEKGVAAMLKHAYNMCHVKDCVEGESGRLMTVDLRKMFELARQNSYRGFYSMEFETEAGDPIEGTKRLVQESLKYLA